MRTTRRSFLGGMAVATALSTATVAQVSTEKHADAELLALTKQFEEAHSQFQKTDESLPAYQAAYWKIAPSGAGVLFEEHQAGPWFYLQDYYRDPTSPTFEVLKAENGRRMKAVKSYIIDQQIKVGTLNQKLSLSVRALAVRFEEDEEEAVRASGLGSALQQYADAERKLRDVVQQIVKHRAVTLEGIALKVKATAAYAALGVEERYAAALWLSNAIWSDLGEEA